MTKKRSGSRKVVAEEGNRYGRLVVLERSGSLGKLAAWKCRCDCGQTSRVTGSNLRSGNTSSCGCESKKGMAARYSRSIVPPSSTALKTVLSQYRTSASRRGLEWLLSDTQALLLFSGDCHYCGVPPSNTASYGTAKATYSGIDRVDNSLGYIDGNVVSCCIQCNRAKSAFNSMAFLAWIERTYDHSIAKTKANA